LAEFHPPIVTELDELELAAGLGFPVVADRIQQEARKMIEDHSMDSDTANAQAQYISTVALNEMNHWVQTYRIAVAGDVPFQAAFFSAHQGVGFEPGYLTVPAGNAQELPLTTSSMEYPHAVQSSRGAHSAPRPDSDTEIFSNYGAQFLGISTPCQTTAEGDDTGSGLLNELMSAEPGPQFGFVDVSNPWRNSSDLPLM
jgi:hypothetical protein